MKMRLTEGEKRLILVGQGTIYCTTYSREDDTKKNREKAKELKIEIQVEKDISFLIGTLSIKACSMTGELERQENTNNEILRGKEPLHYIQQSCNPNR